MCRELRHLPAAAVRSAPQGARAGERHRARRSAGDGGRAATQQPPAATLADRGFPKSPHGAGCDPSAGGSRAAGAGPRARSPGQQRHPGGTVPGSQLRNPVPQVAEILPLRRQLKSTPLHSRSSRKMRHASRNATPPRCCGTTGPARQVNWRTPSSTASQRNAGGSGATAVLPTQG